MSWDDHNGVAIGGSSLQSRWFFENNDCGILDIDKVQRVAIEGARDHAVTARYFSKRHAPQNIVLVNEVRCAKSYYCENKCQGPKCLITFNELKETLKYEKGKKISWVDMERIGMLRREKNFKSAWEGHFGEGFPCPEIRRRVICRRDCLKEGSAYRSTDGFIYTQTDSD
jgi:hypothetical protein